MGNELILTAIGAVVAAVVASVSAWYERRRPEVKRARAVDRMTANLALLEALDKAIAAAPGEPLSEDLQGAREQTVQQLRRLVLDLVGTPAEAVRAASEPVAVPAPAPASRAPAGGGLRLYLLFYPWRSIWDGLRRLLFFFCLFLFTVTTVLIVLDPETHPGGEYWPAVPVFAFFFLGLPTVLTYTLALTRERRRLQLTAT